MMKFLKSKSGASMILALILMIVFLVIGASVLTAATVASNSASELRMEKQRYYFARSVADTFTRSLTNEYGVITSFVKKMIAQNMDRTEFECTLSAIGLPKDMTKNDALGRAMEINMEPVRIKVEGALVDGIGEDAVLKRLEKMTAEFIVYYGGQSYRLYGVYTYMEPVNEEETGWKLLEYYQ